MGPNRRLGVLVAYDLRLAIGSRRGLVFVGFFAMVWGWFLWKLSGGIAEQLHDDKINALISMFMGRISRLIGERPATLSAYFVITLTLVPWFAMVSACNQTAGDLATKHLRFLMPRVGRVNIYFARLLGAAIVVGGAQLLGAVAVTGVQLSLRVAPPAQVLAFGAQIALVLTVYSLAYVAMMAFVSVVTASSRLSLMAGLGGYVLVLILAALLAHLWSPLARLGYLLPSELVNELMQPDLGGALTGLAGIAVYIVAYTYAGLRVFRVRDA